MSQNADDDRDINVEIASASLQPFTDQQWRINQDYIINTVITGNTFALLHSPWPVC